MLEGNAARQADALAASVAALGEAAEAYRAYETALTQKRWLSEACAGTSPKGARPTGLVRTALRDQSGTPVSVTAALDVALAALKGLVKE